MPQFVCHFGALHHAGIEEDEVHVGQLLQHAAQGGDLHLAASVGVWAVAVVVYPKGLAARNPAAGMRPQHQSVVLGGKFLDYLAQRAQHGQRVGAVLVVPVSVPQPHPLLGTHPCDGGLYVAVHIQHQVAAFGDASRRARHLYRVASGKGCQTVLGSHIHDDGALCLLHRLGQILLVVVARLAEQRAYIYNE